MSTDAHTASAAYKTPLVSLVIPVYNAEQYLPSTLDSILEQTIDKDKLEVLLVVDGSPDGSEAVCRSYAEKNQLFRVFAKENEGPSATRNFGITHAKGKYIMFLDADDKLSAVTLQKVSAFFEKHYDEVDLVAYPHFDYEGGERCAAQHNRYKTLDHTGIYDLAIHPYLAQAHISIAIKNEGAATHLFDTDKSYHEDLQFCTEILSKKWKLGFVAEAEYKYNIDNEGGLVSNNFYAYYIFESTTRWFEELFAQEPVHPYLQGVLLNDLVYKLRMDAIFPYHYEAQAYSEALERIRRLVAKIDPTVLADHPTMPVKHKIYWLKFCGREVQSVLGTYSLTITAEGAAIERQNRLPIVLRRMQVNDGILFGLGYIESALFSVREDVTPKVYAVENGKLRELEVFDSLESLMKPLLKLGRIFAFRYEVDLKQVKRLEFVIDAGDGKRMPALLRYRPYGYMNSLVTTMDLGGYRILRRNDAVLFKKIEQVDCLLSASARTLKFIKFPRLFLRRMLIILYSLLGRRVWLYNDQSTVQKDNAYLQFQNDFSKKDKVRRYYVYDRPKNEMKPLFKGRQRRFLVRKNSLKHRILHCNCEYILTAFFGRVPITPFESEKEELYYEDLQRFRIVYLQHGVLHAALHVSNHAEKCRADLVVCSAPWEKQNLIRNYGYAPHQLLETGMARYDCIDRAKAPERRILLAPSWRKYFSQQVSTDNWAGALGKIVNSDYFRNLSAFLDDPRLHKMLEEKDYYLDVKWHPILSNAAGLYEPKHERIQVIRATPPAEQYSVFLTDFSSYVFDFAYLGRAIQYFLPDPIQWKAGMNHYRALDLPVEEAFGEFSDNAADALRNLLDLAQRDFVVKPVYAKRMASFYYPFADCAEGLYQKLANHQ
ncbi:MAG: CDP-glycerol:glycerophosphate glycerophosphotransferase [Oscillospiraceae bacterium]|jgi:glycosyltransferase involved in cell wall biosynthesis|nr:CDP-glycerol:glycerophosphate glycerophosphotransferase [Oscillospiraceae bacterium]